MTFGGGGQWGDLLYVCDPSLTASNGQLDGASRIAYVTSGGVVGTFAQDATLLKGAGSIAIDRAASSTTTCSSRTCSTSACCASRTAARSASSRRASAISPARGASRSTDGALYVADAGSGDSFAPDRALGAGPGDPHRARRRGGRRRAFGAQRTRAVARDAQPNGGDVSVRWTLPVAGRARGRVRRERTPRAHAGRRRARGGRARGPLGRTRRARRGRARRLYFVRLRAAGERRTTRVVRLPWFRGGHADAASSRRTVCSMSAVFGTTIVPPSVVEQRLLRGDRAHDTALAVHLPSCCPAPNTRARRNPRSGCASRHACRGRTTAEREREPEKITIVRMLRMRVSTLAGRAPRSRPRTA